MKIIPSLLAEKYDDFCRMVKEAESFTDYVQFDLMDGLFVETLSFPVEKINSLVTPLSFEVHLMVRNPLSFLMRIRHSGLKRVLFHFEAQTDHEGVIREIRRRGLSPGLAVRPETGLNEIRQWAVQADALLFLTVDPCCYGSPFKPEVLEKVAGARKAFPGREISVDGGVSLDNIGLFRGLGVDSVCVGSRIFLDGDPGKNYRHFMEKVTEEGNR